MGEIKKRIPVKGELYTRKGKTVANDSLYGYYQSISTTDGNLTFIYKDLIPSYEKIGEIIGRSSDGYKKMSKSKVCRDHKFLLKVGLIKEDTYKDLYGNKRQIIVLPQLEEIYQLIPLETLKYLVDISSQDTIRIYTYLLNRSKGIKNYTFTIKSLLEMLGYKETRQTRDYNRIKNILNNLHNNELIKIRKTYVKCDKSGIGVIPCYILEDVSFNYKKVV